MTNNAEFQDEIGENHIATSAQNPIRKDAFLISDEEKIRLIKKDVENILSTLGIDLTDDSLKGTPNRVAKMFVNELFGGLNPNKKPKASTFENNYKYGEMLVEKNITLYSTCEHHLLPIIGRAHVAYISNGRVIGGVAGSANITARTTDGNFIASCLVTVTPAVAVSAIVLDKSSFFLANPGIISLIPTIYPANATNKNII
jgi:hypothetical protein